MILFTMLFMIMAILVVVAVFTIAIGGSAFIIVFADIIVCVAILWFIIKKLAKKKRK